MVRGQPTTRASGAAGIGRLLARSAPEPPGAFTPLAGSDFVMGRVLRGRRRLCANQKGSELVSQRLKR